jgi:hypothetical protein
VVEGKLKLTNFVHPPYDSIRPARSTGLSTTYQSSAFDTQRRITFYITGGSTDFSASFTITGTRQGGGVVTETITGSTAGTATTTYDWVRDVLRREHTVAMRVIQDDIAPIDLDTFESYWIEQFPDLINSNASGRTTPSPTAEKIINAIKSGLHLRSP